MTTLWVVLSLLTAAVMIVFTIAVADGLWTFIKLAVMNTALWFIIFMLTALLIGQLHTVGTVISCAIYALFLLGVYKLSRAFATIGRARKHPENYIVLDKHCGSCGRALMPDPLSFGDEKKPYMHIYKPDTPHDVVIADGAPELLDGLDVSHRLADH